jgi:hypothetical protein
VETCSLRVPLRLGSLGLDDKDPGHAIERGSLRRGVSLLVNILGDLRGGVTEEFLDHLDVLTFLTEQRCQAMAESVPASLL